MQPQARDAPAEALEDAMLARRVMEAAPAIDGAAEAEFCRRFGPRIRRYGLKHLRDHAAAADLVQDVLMLALKRLREGGVREPEKLASFILGACRQVMIDQGRGARRRQQLLEVYAEDVRASAPASEPLLDAERLRMCLERLAQRERTVILLTFYDQSPAAEVARQLGLSEQNVRVIRHRSVRRLRACIEGGPATESAQ